MYCHRCANQDPQFFAYDPFHKNWYCRRCIAFGRVNADEQLPINHYPTKIHKGTYTLQYPLTLAQKQASAQIAHHQAQGKDVLVYAACGSGKTELVMDSIQRYVNAGKKVGFAISRRQVVLEIKERMAQAFPFLQVIAVCEGYTQVVDGDLIICTMHQLYRYVQSFDLLILDEIDAFPYRGNPVLEHIAQSACRGARLYLTATPDEALLAKVKRKELAMVELFQRPHGYPLVEPRLIHTFPPFQFFALWHFLYRHKKAGIQVLCFVPTIALANRFQRLLGVLFRCAAFTSKQERKEELLKRFHQRHYDFLICTTVLERGITIKGVDVIVWQSDHAVYSEASLIQILGRVGRSVDQPSGEGVLLCTRVTSDIKRCIRAIQRMNRTLHATKSIHVTDIA